MSTESKKKKVRIRAGGGVEHLPSKYEALNSLVPPSLKNINK
jgi:hypothetical protein